MMKKKICGIYMISTVEGECLVGSSKDIARRWSWYLAILKANKLTRYPALQEAFNDDINNVKFEILEECDEDDLGSLELSYFRYIEAVDGLELINIQKHKANRHSVRCTKNMKAAQRGSKNGNCRLSDMDVLNIRHMHHMGTSVKELAEQYNISYKYCLGVVNRSKRSEVQ